MKTKSFTAMYIGTRVSPKGYTVKTWYGYPLCLGVGNFNLTSTSTVTFGFDEVRGEVIREVSDRQSTNF